MKLALQAREALTKEERIEVDKKFDRIRGAIYYEEVVAPEQARRHAIGFEEPCYDGQEDLYISDNKNRENLEKLQENHNIKTLCLDNLENLKSLSGINKLPNINELYIISLGNLVDLKGLENLTKLHELGLKHLIKLTDMQSLGYLPSLKVLSTDDNDGRLRALDGIEQSPSIEAVGLDGIFAKTNLQALERLPKLKMVFIYKKQTTTNKFGINDGLMINLKSLALPAGVELLQAQGCVDEDGSEKRSQEPGFIKLGCFQHTSNLASNMASMAENEMSAGTAFVATPESPLPIISPKEVLSRISSPG